MLSNARQTTFMTSLERVVAIELASYPEPARGKLTTVQSRRDIPFAIDRIFYLHGIQNDCERGAHAHRETEQVFIAVAGSYTLDLTDPHGSKTYAMKDPNRALYVPPMIWTRVYNFSPNAVCLVLASLPYDAADYIRDWDEYVSAARKQPQ